LKEKEIDMIDAVGIESYDAYYVQCTKELVTSLGCLCFKFSGQHLVSFYMPEELSKAFRSTINRRD
jgi:hypothetical protein